MRYGVDKLILQTIDLFQVGNILHRDRYADPRDGGSIARKAPARRQSQFHGEVMV